MGLHSSNTQGCPGASTAPLLKAVQGPPQLQYSRLSRGLHSSNTQGCPGASTAPILKAVQGPPQLQYSRLPRGLHSSTHQGCPGASTCLNPVLAIPVVEHRLEQEIAQWVHIVHFRSKLKVEGNLSAKSTL